MRLSAPIYQLKRQAKLLSRENSVPLNEALSVIAKREGFQSWSLLAARYGKTGPATKIFAALKPGDKLKIKIIKVDIEQMKIGVSAQP